MIVRLEDFKGHISLPNLEGLDPQVLVVSNALMDYAELEEPRLMNKLFGFELAKRIQDATDDLGVVDPTDQTIVDLIVGKDDYLGLRPLIANFLYCSYIDSKDDEFTGMGVVQEDVKSSIRITLRHRFARAWREYFNLTIGEYASSKVIVRSGGTGIIWNNTDYYGTKPLRVYMIEVADDFPDMVDRFYLIKNDNFYGI